MADRQPVEWTPWGGEGRLTQRNSGKDDGQATQQGNVRPVPVAGPKEQTTKERR